MKTTDKSKHEEALKKRAALRDLSRKLKQLADMGVISPSDNGTINGLLREYYSKAGATDLKTFGEWKKLGYSVKKGEKAFLLWGRPRDINKKEKETDKETEEEKDDFFPVAYMFSISQVIKK